MNKIKTFILLIPFIGLSCWAMYYAHFVKNATEVTLPITGYDPRNLLSGHYIEFQIDWKNADCKQANWNGLCPRKDFLGVNRYYIPEKEAHDLERLINSRQYETEIIFAYQKDFRPVVKGLLINGKKWENYIKN